MKKFIKVSFFILGIFTLFIACLLYTSDAADEEDSVDLGGRRIIKKKKKAELQRERVVSVGKRKR
ncbi:hypothetical protein CDFC105_93889 [Clostridioides difficile]|nr:hypothetical protein CDFC105_93889 [Clostridioides difficile]